MIGSERNRRSRVGGRKGLNRTNVNVLLRSLVGLFFVAMTAVPAGAADPVTWKNLAKESRPRLLGGRNAFSRTPLTGRESLQQFFVRNHDDLAAVLTLSGWSGDPGDLFSAVAAGRFDETDLPVGGRLLWMASRLGGKKPQIRENVVWDGKAPAPAFRVELVSRGTKWVFVVPKACGNLSLVSKVGTGKMTVSLSSGEMNLTDPEGNAITVKPGQSGVVPVSPVDGAAAGQAGVPTNLEVRHGVVELRGYSSPISLLVEGGNQATMVQDEEGRVKLDLPPGNASAIPIKVGDAVGTISAGAGLSVDWPAPVCVLSVKSNRSCVPAEVEIDAGGSSVAGGTIASVTVKAELPGGEVVDLGPPVSGSSFHWTRSFDRPGAIRFTAVAVSDKGKSSAESCSAAVELTRCAPPVPVVDCRLDSKVAEGKPGAFHLDGSRSSSKGGKIETIVVDVYTDEGKKLRELRLEPPFTRDIGFPAPGTYRLEAFAVDDFGQKSENVWKKTVIIEPTLLYSVSVFGGIRSGADIDDGMIGGIGNDFSIRLRPGFDLSLGASVVRFQGDHTTGARLEIGALRRFRGTFFGGGVGLSTLGVESGTAGNAFLRAGTDLGFKGRPMQWYLETRFDRHGVDVVTGLAVTLDAR